MQYSGKDVPLVVHLLYRLDIGGMETLMVNCINRMPAERYRHAIVCLTESSDFAKNITHPGVEIYELKKPPGLGLETHLKVWQLLRRLKPTVLHTYNLAGIEYHLVAALAGVPVRVHAEHGRDISDPEGKNPRHNLLRRLLAPLVHAFVPVSADLQGWLKTVIGIPDRKNRLLANGVDTQRFTPRAPEIASDTGEITRVRADHFVIGTVGRLNAVKNHAAMLRAFARLREKLPYQAHRLRLVIVGDGACMEPLRAQIRESGLQDVVWLAGARSNVSDLMQGFSLFALSSIAEGTPVTILEAMACGLPVVSTRVGGIPEVVQHERHGLLVPEGDVEAMADAFAWYVEHPVELASQGKAARQYAEEHFSIDATVNGYLGLYDALRPTNFRASEAIKPCAEL